MPDNYTSVGYTKNSLGQDILDTRGGPNESVYASTGKRQNVVSKSANFSVSAADSGTVYMVTAQDVVASLPQAQAGLEYTFVVLAPSSSTGLSVSPYASDYILGGGFTVAVNKDAINTAATDASGDLLRVVSGYSSNFWFIRDKIGTWARET